MAPTEHGDSTEGMVSLGHGSQVGWGAEDRNSQHVGRGEADGGDGSWSKGTRRSSQVRHGDHLRLQQDPLDGGAGTEIASAEWSASGHWGTRQVGANQAEGLSPLAIATEAAAG